MRRRRPSCADARRCPSLPHPRLKELARLDQRVEAKCDGLRIAGGDGCKIAAQQFEEHPDPGEAFTAAVLAFETGDREKLRRVDDARMATPEAERGSISALGWLQSPGKPHFVSV